MAFFEVAEDCLFSLFPLVWSMRKFANDTILCA